MTKRFLGAVQFLTVLPIRSRTASPGQSAAFFPLVGGLLGATAGIVVLLFHNFGPLFAIVWLVAITGCLHEDGLADVADAIRAGRTREKMLSILNDSRIGTYGAVALIVSFAVRWLALSQGIAPPVAGLATALALSRTSMVVVAAFTASVGSGMGGEFISACTPRVLWLALGQAVTIVALASPFIGWQYSLALVAAAAAVAFLARTYFLRRLGGVNGDCLGATSQAVEMVCLVVLAWRPSF